MKRFRPTVVILVAIAMVLLGTMAHSETSRPEAPTGKSVERLAAGTPLPYKPGEVLVKFKEGVSPTRQSELKSIAGAAETIQTIGPEGNPCLQLVALEDGVSVERAAVSLSSRPEVAYAEPNYLRKPSYTPSDPDFPKEWGLHNSGQTIKTSVGTKGSDIDATEAWNIEKGNTNDVTVAVIDSGIDLGHPDLDGKLWVNTGEVPADGIDNDANTFVDDYNGYAWSGISQYNYFMYDGSSWYITSWDLGNDAATQMFAQSLTARAMSTGLQTQPLTHAGIMLSKTGTPAATITVSVRSTLGGANLASYTINPAEVGTSPTEIFKPLSGTVNLNRGQTYYLVFQTSGIDTNNYYSIYDNWGAFNQYSFDSYAEGQEYQWDGVSAWTPWAADDFYFRTNDYYYPYDLNGHGTHCSGIVGAENNGQGVVGVSFGSKTKVMPLKCGDSSGSLFMADTIAATYYAADNGADILSMSYGGVGYLQAEQDALTYAHNQGVTPFAASGNSFDSTMQYPAGYLHVLGVGATTNRDEKAAFSTYNSSVDLSAPGQDIYSTMPTYPVCMNSSGYSQNYSYMSGTSMACPMAAGVGALAKSKYPGYTPSQVQNRLQNTADDLGASGRDDKFGYGRVNACRAVGGTPNPILNSISPTSGKAGDTVTVSGNDFGNTRNSDVYFGSTSAASYSSWKTDEIKCKVPSGLDAGTVKVKVTTAGGTSATKDFTVQAEQVQDTWYLAEGTTDWGFDCHISIENPNSSEVTSRITYMTDAGAVDGGAVIMPPLSRATVNPADTLGAKDFSTRVECEEGKTIAVDRTMIWVGTGASVPGAHNSVGVTSPAKTWYLPEGSSDWGFECWLLIQNPNSSTVTCVVTYMIEGEESQSFTKAVDTNSRATFNMADDIGAADASIMVTCNDGPIIPERAMYRNNRREGHDSIGTTTPATDYYLAEGTTDWGFTTYVLIQNPNATNTDVTITYMTSSGPVPQATFNMPANSRKTIRVNDVMPGTDFSTQVHGTQPIIAERAMYWDNGTGEACHDSIGLSAPHTTFYLPDGASYSDWETFTLVQNPNDSDVEVEVSYLGPSGLLSSFTDTVSANSRSTYNMGDVLNPADVWTEVGVIVTSKTAGKKIMVERAMYGYSRAAGTDTIGGYCD